MNDEIDLISVLLNLYKRKWLVLAFILTGAVAGCVLSSLLYVKLYMVESYVLMQSPQMVTTGNEVNNRYIINDVVTKSYDVVLQSEQTLQKVALSQYDYTENGHQLKTNLLTYLNTDKIGMVVEKIKNNLNFDLKKNKSVIQFTYTDPNPEIAAQVLNNIICEFDDYFHVQFNSASQRNIEFIIKTLETAKKELDESRRQVDVFKDENKQLKYSTDSDKYSVFHSSELELQKLKENVETKKLIYNNLKNNYEQLKLQILENVPTITILEKAMPPLDPVPCRYLRGIFLGSITGLAIVIILIAITKFQLIFKKFIQAGEIRKAEESVFL